MKRSNLSGTCFQIEHVSSTNFFESLGLKIPKAKALDSKYSINGLETIRDRGKPRATPSVWS